MGVGLYQMWEGRIGPKMVKATKWLWSMRMTALDEGIWAMLSGSQITAGWEMMGDETAGVDHSWERLAANRGGGSVASVGREGEGSSQHNRRGPRQISAWPPPPAQATPSKICLATG